MVTLHAAGNWPPEFTLIRALVERGHEVRVISDASHAEQITTAGAAYRAYRYAPQRDPTTRYANLSETEMTRLVRTVLLSRAYADELLAEVDREAADVLLVDWMLLMAGVAAESTGLPMATLWHTVYARAAGLTRMGAPMVEQLNAFREEKRLPPVDDLRESVERAHAIIAFTHEAFDTAGKDAPAHLHYVGPLACLPEPFQPHRLPWADDDRRPLILVSYSTSFQDQVSILQRVADAVADLSVRVLLTLGEAIRADELRLPDNVVARKFVPHAAVLPDASLVVTHAGHGTVMAATTAGVPMVCTPMGRDQHTVSECVERRGLGVVAPMTASSEELRGLIASAVGDEELHQRARRFAAGVNLEAGLRRAVQVLEGLQSTRPATRSV